MEETWKDIYFIENGIEWDYRGLYQVSNLGNVKSLNYGRTGKEKILKNTKSEDGYLRVDLCKNKKRKNFKIHRLVAHMFCNGYEDGLEPDHINTIRYDNRAENLVWKTRKENCNNPITLKKLSNIMIGVAKKGKEHYRAKKVVQYDLDENLIKIWDCISDIERELNFSRSNISKVCKGKQKTAYGFIWKYTD